MFAAKRALLVAFGLLLLVPALRADEAEDKKLFEKVMKRLLKNDAFVREYPEKFVYPPRAFIKPKSEKEFNAYASAHKLCGAEEDPKTGKIRPVVMITQGFLDRIVKGDEHSLAVIMGHELAHLTKDHVSGDRKGESAVVILSFGRDEEIEADLSGMRYAISSGYPYRKGVAKSFKEMRLLAKYSSFEGLNATHPTWEERLVFLDREQAKLWSAMTAFQNGYAFLEMEQYQSAQQCFKAVTAEFPDCHEAWANLGYARLMQYCDALEYDDLMRYGIGQIVTGGFYGRPDSLEAKVRGTDEKLWKDAVKALEKALDLKAEQSLPRSSLGIAYLVHPEGKDIKTAKKWFAQAIDQFKNDPELRRNPIGLASVLVNAGVADLADGKADEASFKFQDAEDIAKSERLTTVVRTMEDAILYNQALVLARSKEKEDKQRAFRDFEIYLNRNAPDTAWWPIAYTHYNKLGKELDIKARTRSSFFRKPAPQDLRVIASVTIGKEVITLSDPVKDAVRRLGEDDGEPIPLYPDSKIVRWRFVDQGIDLLAKDKVLAIFLTSKKSPPVTLRPIGLGGEAKELKVGMGEDNAKFLLKEQLCDRSQRAIADARTTYHFYPLLGLAVRYGNARVEEIAIAQMPRRMFDEK
jgi:tetratricopeptide (TPR) repeat protein